jgi:hypothetical protein
MREVVFHRGTSAGTMFTAGFARAALKAKTSKTA